MTATQVFRAVATGEGETALTALARVSALPKARIKDAMTKGAVWLRRGKSERRLRRATFALRASDTLSLHYNPEILAKVAPTATLLADERHYSVWDKPAGQLAQGTREGDHCALLRQAELQLRREVYLVHRLDREASGLMLVAHNGRAAAALSALFAGTDKEAGMHKRYRIEVLGALPDAGEFAAPLDGKAALTRFQRTGVAAFGSSSAEVELVTGRKHQIRRHFAEAGFPVLGDPRYGSGNEDPRGLQLRAVELRFTCPLTGLQRHYTTPGNAS